MTTAPFDPLHALRVLRKHRVRFILIGGFAGRLRGSPTVTNDLDLCYARDGENLERLAAALQDLKARLRGVPEHVRFLLDARTLKSGDHFTFVTSAGNLDCLGFPAGSGGYEGLVDRAEEMDLGGIRTSVVSLDDLILIKRAAARPKDLIEVEVLKALREETRRPRRR